MKIVRVCLLPVCECGNVIAGLEVNNIMNNDGWKSMQPFRPDKCPRCQKVIGRMVIDTQYLQAFVDLKE